MMRKALFLSVLTALAVLCGPAGLHGQEDPSTSCDVRKAGLDPVKFHLYLTKDTPYTAWPLWPGTSAMAPARPPFSHGTFRTTYVNPAALRSIREGRGMDFGALIVTESFDAGRKLTGLSVKLKIRGYHPEAGDWHWFQYDAGGAVLSCGRTAVCIGCHAARKENDYLMTEPARE
ncbi:MAG TPA: cytochrome P460 family protein [Nitrospirota bacterium]|nr:cytochrome P460 family protein [Nitrospirota bacterium]